ncbi:MAG TPA: hypothetical protein VGE74_12830 [Gemmata sp.]
MSVVFIQEMTGRDGSKDVDTNKRYRRTWIVRTDRPQDGAGVVLNAAPVAFNDIYQYEDDSGPISATITDPLAVCVDIRATQDNPNDPQDWRVTAEYAGIDDPLAQPADVEYSPTRYQKALVTDLDNKAVTNAAGDPFESGILVDRTRFTLTIVKPVLDWDAAAADEFNDSVNRDDFIPTPGKTAFKKETCKLTWGAKRMRRAGTNSFYWLRTAVIDIDKEGWKVKLRNAGFNELVYSGPPDEVLLKKIKIMISPGMEATSPQLLHPDGTAVGKLKPGDPVPPLLEFRGYNVKSWETLGLQY